MILGIDPGLTGGLAIRTKEGLLIEPMPVCGDELDLATLTRWLKETRGCFEMAYLEQVSAMPKQGVASMFKFGDTFGSIKGILTALGIPFELVNPRSWTKEMHAGVPILTKQTPEGPKKDIKEMSKLAATRLFPHTDFRESDRCRTPHKGMVDASLIAEWGYRRRSA